MERTTEEWQKLFPVLEMEMTDRSLKIRLADDTASLEATLPKEFMDHLCEKWRAYQNFEMPGTTTFGRYYTGAWSKAV